MDTRHATYLAHELIIYYGLHRQGYKVVLGQQKTMCGWCNEHRKEIGLCEPYVEVNDITNVRDTILHEIAHAIAGVKNNHNDIWKYVCRQIGASPCRTNPTKDKPKGRYKAECDCRVHYMHRRTRRLYGCRVCKRTLKFVDTKQLDFK